VLPIKIQVRAKDEKGKLVELDSEVLIKVVSKEEVASAVKDEELLKRFAQVEIGDRASAALRLEKEGRRQEASELLKNILEKHQTRVDKETRQHYQDMSARMAVGMDELDRKRSHSDAYMMKKMMMGAQSYRLMENVAGHLVFEKDGQNVLLDTGSHITFGRNENFEFMGRYRQIQPSFLEFSPDYLTKMIGVRIDTLLGMDVLKDLFFRINLHDRLIHFSEMPLPTSGVRVPLETVMGVPFVRIMMNSSPQKVFVDSGAKIHFVRKHVVEGLEAIDTEMDWYPYIGEFETEVFEIPIELAGETHSMRCGVLPPLLDTALATTGGIEGLLGTEAFRKYIATFEPGTHLMYLERY